MKSKDRIQRAHDLIHGMLTLNEMGKLVPPMPAQIQQTQSAVADFLCWILDHPGGATVDRALEGLETVLKLMKVQVVSEDTLGGVHTAPTGEGGTA